MKLLFIFFGLSAHSWDQHGELCRMTQTLKNVSIGAYHRHPMNRAGISASNFGTNLHL